MTVIAPRKSVFKRKMMVTRMLLFGCFWLSLQGWRIAQNLFNPPRGDKAGGILHTDLSFSGGFIERNLASDKTS